MVFWVPGRPGIPCVRAFGHPSFWGSFAPSICRFVGSSLPCGRWGTQQWLGGVQHIPGIVRMCWGQYLYPPCPEGKGIHLSVWGSYDGCLGYVCWGTGEFGKSCLTVASMV